MRDRFLHEFDALWIDCLNGDSRETGKLTPEGKPDPSVFSTEFNREGIRVGTTIGLLVRNSEREPAPAVYFRQYWGVNKRAELLESLRDPDLPSHYEQVQPNHDNRYSFRPSNVAAHYRAWPRMPDLAQEASNGLMEKRSGALIDIDRDRPRPAHADVLRSPGELGGTGNAEKWVNRRCGAIRCEESSDESA